MPFTFNGIGTSVCGSRGYVSWGGQHDHDAVECLVVFFMPVIPYAAVHTYGWEGTNYRKVPIRWSWGLVLRAFLRHWIWGLVFAGGICLLIGTVGKEAPQGKATLVAIGLLLIAVGALVLWLLKTTDARTRRIRRVLGRHDLGSSDPATWTNDVLRQLAGPAEMFQVASYGAAVPPAVDAGEFSKAMFAARLAVALESREQGEALTDAILNLPQVEQALSGKSPS